MKLDDIQSDLSNSLANIDKNNYILHSVMHHLKNNCNHTEIDIIHSEIYDLTPADYDTIAEFISDYQPIFDTVDFPFKECFRCLKARSINLDLI